MTFAKKSLSVVLAVMMLVTSLVTGTSVFAAETKNFVPTSAENQAYTANVKLVQEDGSQYYDYEDSYFAFTPAVSGTYALKLDTVPLYRTYDSQKYEYQYTNAPVNKDSYRVDSASVGVYQDKEMKKWVDSVNTYKSATSYIYDAEEKDIVSDETKDVQVDNYTTFSLIGGETYYIDAYASCSTGSKYDETTQKYVPVVNYLTQAAFSIAPVDWTYSYSSKSEKVEIAVPADYDGWYADDVKVLPNGTKVVEMYNSTYSASTGYVGKGADAIVPETINGLPVKRVSGTTNKNIKSLVLSSAVESIGSFSNLKSLAAVSLGNSLKSIPGGAFENDSALASIAVPATVKTIGAYAFYGCAALSSVALAGGLTSVGDYAFYNTGLKSVVIPATVKSIGDYAFGYETNFDTNTVDPYDTTQVAVPGFIIGGTAGTEAQYYAEINGIAFGDVANCAAGNHPYAVTTKAATVFAKGTKTYVCPVCGATKTSAIAKKTLKIKSAKSAKKGQITVKVAKPAGLTGYKVQVSTSKKFTKKTTKTVTVKSKKALSKTIKGLKSGKKYYVRVRAYKTSGKKTVYSKYTKVKTVKVK